MNKQEYIEYLAHPVWASKREELFRSLGRRCSHSGCGVSTSLHIHHKTYTRGKLPWEYPTENFEVLCEEHHNEAHAIPYVQNKCRACGKVIPQSFERCIPCQNKAHREQARELDRVKRDRDRLETERLRTEVVAVGGGQSQPSSKSSWLPLLVAVILTCFLALVFWPQRKTTSSVRPSYRTATRTATPPEQTERAAPPLTPTFAPKQVEHTERKQFDRDSSEASATRITQSKATRTDYGDFRRQLGQFVEFSAQIVEVRYAANGNAYLDVGGRYPNATLTLVVFKNRLSRFGDLREFTGHTVRINGRVTQYQEALQVILESKNQIRLE